MSAHGGPDINNTGLVFAYDMNNNKKSWKGATTTNLANEPNNIATIAASAGTTKTLNTIKLPTEVLKTSPGDMGDQIVGSGWIAWTNTGVTAGLQYMVSWYVKGFGAQNSIYWSWGGSHTGTKTTFDVSLITGAITSLTLIPGETCAAEYIEDGWWRISCSTTMTDTACYPQVSYTTGVYLCGIQIEQRSFLTPFVKGTRSNTQALLDLTSNNTVTASSLTYNSNGTFSFNGTSNEIHPPINHSYLSSSALEVIFRSNLHGSGYKTIFGYRHNVGYSVPTIGSLYLSGNTLNAAVITASQVYRVATASVTIDTNVYYHVILNKNTTTGLLEIYVNGVLSGTQTFDAATYGQWTTAGSYIGENFLDIGKSTNTFAGQGWSTDYFSGIIPMARVYNRTLTAAEVAQHYKASKGRYSQYQTMTYTATSNVTLTNNGTQEVNMFKTADDGGWNGEVRSIETFEAPCTIEFSKQAGVTNNGASHAMIGWNEDPITNTSYTSMDYASYPYATGSYSVYNNGSQVHSSGVWDVNKRFYIVYDIDGYIRHYNDSTLLYSANYGTNKIVYVDSSYYAVNSTFGGFTKVKVIRAAWNGTNYV